MSMFGNRGQQMANPISGQEVARFASYAQAQKAVDFLADSNFPVAKVMIVGRDLMSVEQVISKLSYGKVAAAGAMSGAWFGLFVGVLMSMFVPVAGTTMQAILFGVAIGAAFGMLFAMASYGATRGQRDFASRTTVTARAYSVLCADEVAGQAQRMFAAQGIGSTSFDAPVVSHSSLSVPPPVVGEGSPWAVSGNDRTRPTHPTADAGTGPGGEAAGQPTPAPAGTAPSGGGTSGVGAGEVGSGDAGGVSPAGSEQGAATTTPTASHDYEPDRPNPFRAPNI